MAILTATSLQGNLFVDGVIRDSSNLPGTLGQQLITDGVNNNWTTRGGSANIRAFRASGIGNQTMPVPLSFVDMDQADFVTGGGNPDFTNVGNGTWTVNNTGVYRVSYNLCVLSAANNSTELGAILVSFNINGQEYNSPIPQGVGNASSERQNGTDYNVNIENRISKTFIVDLNANDVIGLVGFRRGQVVGGNPRIDLSRSTFSAFGVS